MISVKCLQCNKEFQILKSELKRGGGKFCSRKCYSDSTKGQKRVKEWGQKISEGQKKSIQEGKFKRKFRIKGEFKHSKETKKKISESVKKNPNRYWLGKKRPEIGKILSRANLGRTGEKSSSWKGGWRNKLPKCIYCSKSLSNKISKRCNHCKGLRGEKNPWWRGGITPLVMQIRHCFKYRQWRSDVFTRDDYTCQICGIRGGILNVDHIKPFSIIFNENNIKTLQEAIDCEEFWNINNGRTLCKHCHLKYGIKPNKKQ